MPIDKYPFVFFSDLARLLRHGSEPLEAIINEISKPEARAALISRLTALAEFSKDVSRQKSQHRRSPRASNNIEGTEEALQVLQAKDTKRYEILVELRHHLKAKARTLDRKSLTQVSDKMGIHFGAKLSRLAIIDRIILKLAQVDDTAFNQGLKDVADLDRGSPEEYMKLAGFITGTSSQERKN